MPTQEELVDTSPCRHGVVEFHVILSPTYQVPVLYFSVRHGQSNLPLTVDTLHEYVLPEDFRPQVDHIGPMGAVTVTVCCRPSSLLSTL